jgi:hypothetical protein
VRIPLIVFQAILLFALAGAAFPQTPQAPSVSEIVAAAADRSKAYREDFRNFLADETKTFSRFGRTGSAEQTRVVESTFLVYRISAENDISAELRNVRSVDGKPVPNAQIQNDKFLAEIEKTSVSRTVLRKLQSASEKFDRTILIFGMTLYQAVILEPHIRTAFDFELVGREKLDGRDVYSLKYLQRQVSPFVRFNQKGDAPDGRTVMNFESNLPKELSKTGFEIRGTLLIDAATFSVLAETRELVIRPNDPIVILSSRFSYRADANGVVLPREISLVAFKPEKSNRKWTSSENYRVDFSYGNFRRTEVDVRIVDDDN